MTYNEVEKRIIDDLKSLRDPQKAKDVARYMKTSRLEFFGVALPEIKRIVKNHIRGLQGEDLLDLMNSLWTKPVFDIRRAAVDVLEEYVKKYDTRLGFELVSKFIDDIDTWALMDPIGATGLGTLICRDPALEQRLIEWRISENKWRRRATILPYLHLSLKTYYDPANNDRILNSLLPHLSDPEFFVAKAVGWVLRELSKRDPKIVQRFIEKHQDRMTPLARREGSKKL